MAHPQPTQALKLELSANFQCLSLPLLPGKKLVANRDFIPKRQNRKTNFKMHSWRRQTSPLNAVELSERAAVLVSANTAVLPRKLAGSRTYFF